MIKTTQRTLLVFMALVFLIICGIRYRQSQFEKLALLNADHIHELIGITKTITENTGGLIQIESLRQQKREVELIK